MQKTCTKCLTAKTLDCFYKAAGYRDGLKSSCKVCSNEAAIHWQQRNKGLMAQRSAERRAINPEKTRESNIRSLRKRRAENLESFRERERIASRNRTSAQRQKISRTYYEKHKAEVQKRNAEQRKIKPETYLAIKAARRAAEHKAKVPWANQFFIREAYHLAKLRERMTGFKWHVDHIVPLKSKLVCGLHVENNLAVIPALTNQRKSNRAWPDMP